MLKVEPGHHATLLALAEAQIQQEKLADAIPVARGGRARASGRPAHHPPARLPRVREPRLRGGAPALRAGARAATRTSTRSRTSSASRCAGSNGTTTRSPRSRRFPTDARALPGGAHADRGHLRAKGRLRRARSPRSSARGRAARRGRSTSTSRAFARAPATSTVRSRSSRACSNQAPDDAELLYNIGRHPRRGEAHRRGARATCEIALVKHPDHAGALNYIGYTWAENGHEPRPGRAVHQRARSS